MSVWDGKSDFEINKAVATSWLPCDYDFDEKNKAVDLVGYATYLGGHGIADERLEKYGEFNPCENASDAWPIILSNNINLLKYEDVDDDEWEAQAGVKLNAFGYDDSSCEFYYYDKNPLRAAMIVFLMINEGKK